MKYIFEILILGLVSVGSFAASVNHTSQRNETETSSEPRDIILHEEEDTPMGRANRRMAVLVVEANRLLRCTKDHIKHLRQEPQDSTAMRILENVLCYGNDLSDIEATERKLFEIVEMGLKNKTENQD